MSSFPGLQSSSCCRKPSNYNCTSFKLHYVSSADLLCAVWCDTKGSISTFPPLSFRRAFSFWYSESPWMKKDDQLFRSDCLGELSCLSVPHRPLLLLSRDSTPILFSPKEMRPPVSEFALWTTPRKIVCNTDATSVFSSLQFFEDSSTLCLSRWAHIAIISLFIIFLRPSVQCRNPSRTRPCPPTSPFQFQHTRHDQQTYFSRF